MYPGSAGPGTGAGPQRPGRGRFADSGPVPTRPAQALPRDRTPEFARRGPDRAAAVEPPPGAASPARRHVPGDERVADPPRPAVGREGPALGRRPERETGFLIVMARSLLQFSHGIPTISLIGGHAVQALMKYECLRLRARRRISASKLPARHGMRTSATSLGNRPGERVWKSMPRWIIRCYHSIGSSSYPYQVLAQRPPASV